jgi:DNA invertase Pin-like site-specific DNA recombinase
MSKVYGYCRVAFESEEEMAEQMELVRTYCKQYGLEVDQYFCDNGVSGLESHREKLNDLLYVVQEGDIVVVKNIARLFRDVRKCMAFMELMDTLGVTVKTIY